jgi:UDP-N-acetylmuramate: L-alanyl-gamma-D-glutamyl-meso-diaminopimelate ligase
MGCWTPREGFSMHGSAVSAALPARWQARRDAAGAGFTLLEDGRVAGEVRWDLLGDHNVDNALAAIAAARHAGVPVNVACAALGEFRGVKRRMELRGEAGGVSVYDDFAHHPTAIATTIAGLRRKVGSARILAVLEPRSNTMKLGVHRDTLAPSLADADATWLYAPPDLGWDAHSVVAGLAGRGRLVGDLDVLVCELVAAARPGDHILVMSNGGFGGLHGKLVTALQTRAAAQGATQR